MFSLRCLSISGGVQKERDGLVVDNVLTLETISVDGDDFGRWRRFFGLTKLVYTRKQNSKKCLDKGKNRLHRPKSSPGLLVPRFG